MEDRNRVTAEGVLRFLVEEEPAVVFACTIGDQGKKSLEVKAGDSKYFVRHDGEVVLKTRDLDAAVERYNSIIV